MYYILQGFFGFVSDIQYINSNYFKNSLVIEGYKVT